MKDEKLGTPFVDFSIGEYGIVGIYTRYGEKRVTELPDGVRIGRKEVEAIMSRWMKTGLCLSKSITVKIITETNNKD